ncbi:MAG: hypothetical protein AB7I42_28370 [Bradyrhizobium sp.]|uniref:hypothetical protein n=1 Tax=Bradyrhizobium sp. TaxID=376 RepID=UPI003D10A724
MKANSEVTKIGYITGLIGHDGPTALQEWLQDHPLQWAIVLAARAALRALPRTNVDGEILQVFRATSIARYSAKYPNSALTNKFIRSATDAERSAIVIPHDYAALSAAAAARTASLIAHARSSRKSASGAHVSAAEAIISSSLSVPEEHRWLLIHAAETDVFQLTDRRTKFGDLMNQKLWLDSEIVAPPFFAECWNSLETDLRADGEHWSVWIDWYNGLLVDNNATESQNVAFTDLAGDLPWREAARPTNVEIARRLAAMEPDPEAIEGIGSPIEIGQLPDGRIGIQPGPFSLPEVPAPLQPEDHQNALTACSSWAVALKKIASSPTFQGRSEYAEILGDYLEWLPSKPGSGNILLADGQARILNKLFVADEPILPTVFASKLAVLLESHIALRSFYPEIERHYQAVNTGRLAKPLPRDAVEAIQRVIQLQTPLVFDVAVSPAIHEVTKPVPEIQPLPPEELPPNDPNRPRPPIDPIAEADPQRSRGYIIATAFNRIWWLLKKGKGAADAVEGWQRTYDLIKPHIGPILDALRNFFPPGGSGSGPSLPPTIGT